MLELMLGKEPFVKEFGVGKDDWSKSVGSGFGFSDFDELFTQLKSGPNVWETDKGWEVEISMPGFKSDDIDVTVADKVLHVKASRKQTSSSRGKLIQHGFKTSQNFTQTVDLGAAGDIENIQARYEDGILTVTVPRRPDLQPRKVKVL